MPKLVMCLFPENTAPKFKPYLSESETQYLVTASKGEGLFVINQDTRIPVEIELREEEKRLFGRGGGR